MGYQKAMNQKEKADLYLLARNVRLRYALDDLEEEALGRLLKGYDAARKYVIRQLDRMGPKMDGSFTKDRALAVLDHVYEMTAGVRSEMGKGVGDMCAEAGEMALKAHNDIVSFGGKVAGFKAVELSREQVRSLVVDTPIGGKSLAGWVDRTFDFQMRERIQAEVIEGAILGEGYPALVKRLENGLNLARRDSITLARTYVQNVNTSAQEAVYKVNDDIVKAVEWTATLEPGYRKTGRGTCLRCAALDGRQWPLKEPHPPAPLHPRCLTGETPVFAPDKLAAIVSTYDGPVFEIGLSNGARFTVTANHMLLTPAGFVPAKLLRKGSHVLYDALVQRVVFGNPDDNHRVPCVEQVVGALAEAPGMMTVRVPVAAEHLHGDGVFVEGGVDVIAPASLLRGDLESFALEHADKGLFGWPDIAEVPLAAKRDLVEPLLWLRAATGGGVGGLSVSDIFISGPSSHHQAIGVRQPSGVHPSTLQSSPDNIAAYAECLRQGVLGLAPSVPGGNLGNGQIGPSGLAPQGLRPVGSNAVPPGYDAHRVRVNAEVLGNLAARFPGRISDADVLFIREKHFRGHVYDLQTFSSLYSIPGVITSNCRCLLVPVTKSWRELGIDADEFEAEVRPWTTRPDKNIDAGGRRTIIEHGFRKGDYGSWFKDQSAAFQRNVLGPGRYELWESGALEWRDLADEWGNLRTLDELKSGKFKRHRTPEGGGPVPMPGELPAPSASGSATRR